MISRELHRPLYQPLHRDLDRVIAVEDGDADPLAGITTILRLQTHNGNGVPLGLYQDTACTVPAVDDGDPVAAWRDELGTSGLLAIQSVETKRPLLRFVDGFPILEFDGVDDYLVIGSNIIGNSDDKTIAAGFKLDDLDSYGGVITALDPFANNGVDIGIGPPGNTLIYGFNADSYQKIEQGGAATGARIAISIRQGSDGSAYTNGSLAGTISGLSGDGDNNPENWIGTSRCQEGNYWDGYISSIVITSRTDVRDRLEANTTQLLPTSLRP